ncbi:hypothetical protein WJX72_006355 [[Myrmecia] bisecta]|uniref:Uncharacterized protein n=1 Tax=[Myrmecia] bisecta TaxID=41462 RepID=A0AAW1QR43_9CHLO
MNSILEPVAPAVVDISDRLDHPFGFPQLKRLDSKQLRFAVVEAVTEARGIKGDVRILQSALIKSNQQRKAAEERTAQLAAEVEALRLQLSISIPVAARARSTSDGLGLINMGQAPSTLASPRGESKPAPPRNKPHRTSSFGRPLSWPVIAYLKDKFVAWGHKDHSSGTSSSVNSTSSGSSGMEPEELVPPRKSLSKANLVNGLVGVRRSRSDTAADGGYRRRRAVDLGRPGCGARDSVMMSTDKRSHSYDACCLPDVASPRTSQERDVIRRRNQAIEDAFCRHYDQYLPPELESRCPVGSPYAKAVLGTAEMRVFRQSNLEKREQMPSVLFESTDLTRGRAPPSVAAQAAVHPKSLPLPLPIVVPVQTMSALFKPTPPSPRAVTPIGAPANGKVALPHYPLAVPGRAL